jgi:hypothetical protein
MRVVSVRGVGWKWLLWEMVANAWPGCAGGAPEQARRRKPSRGKDLRIRIADPAEG